MAEHDEQVAFIEYCDLKGYPCFAIPNGGARRKSEAARLKAEGVRPGIPDLCVPVSRGEYHSLYIEMKSDKGKPTQEQVDWLWRLRGEGMAAYICYGAGNAIACVDWYMSL